MFTAESIKLLVKDARRRTAPTQLHFVDQDDGRDCVKVNEPTDPFNELDPDDLIGTEPVQCTLLLSPPVMSESWWTALVLGRENDAVSPQDALVALAHVAYRLGYARANMGTEPVTVGQLHEMVEALYGAPGWTALMSLWQKAAGIQQPERQPKPDCAPIPTAEPDGKADTPLPPLPASAFQMEEGLHRALPEMPERVAAFLLHVPRDPPVWRYSESPGERAQREQLESEGSWTG